MVEYQQPFKMNSHEQRKFDEIYDQLDSPEKARPKEAFDYWLKWKIKTDLFFFGNDVMGWRTAHRAGRWRVDPKLHRWLAQVLEKNVDTLILIPRLHLKSTWVKLRILQLILNDPNIRIALFSVTAFLVEKELADIKRMFCTPILRRLFPQQIPAPKNKDYKGWEKATQTELTLARDHSLGKIPQEAQLTVGGVGTNIVGLHFDRCFLDDIITDDSVSSVTQMRKTQDWWAYLQPIIETDAVTTITGTPYHYNDIYALMQREQHIPKKNVYIRTNIYNGKPFYNAWFRMKDFERLRKRMGEYKYHCQIECNPTPEADKVFPPPQPTFEPPLPADVKGYKYYLMIDPAATIQEYSDFTAFVIIAVNHLGHVYVVESFSVKRGGETLADILIKYHLRYGFSRVGIELGLQTHLETIMRMKIVEWEKKTKTKIKLEIMPVPLKKQSKRIRIDTTLGTLVRTGIVSISTRCSRLLREMDMFTGKDGDEDDEVDALSMCVYVVDTFPQHHNLDKFFKQPGLTWRDFHKSKKTGWEARFSA